MRLSLYNILLMILFMLMVVWSVLYIFGTIQWPVFPGGVGMLNLPSLGIVIGGLMVAGLISYPATLVLQAIKTGFLVFSQSTITNDGLQKDINTIIEWLRMFRTNQTEAFKVLKQRHQNDFSGYLVSLMNTNYTADEIKELAENQITTNYENRMQVSRVLQSMGNTSPAFGMLGTLFGLIVILDSFEDAAQLGRGLSLALMTTLYGLMFANFVFFPLALKVKVTADKQMFRESMLLEGVLMIRQDKPAMVIRDQLSTFIDREYSDAA